MFLIFCDFKLNSLFKDRDVEAESHEVYVLLDCVISVCVSYRTR